MRDALLSLLLAGLPFTFCQNDGIICTAEWVSGVTVNLTDAATGEPITGATLTLTEGDYTETMENPGSGFYSGAGERPGTYTLTIGATGYESQTRTDLVVHDAPCHVIPVELDIALTPNS